MPSGIKHTIQCHCILPQYKNTSEPVFHKFVVFSIVDDNDVCIPKIVNCNNCGATHKVFDLCKSELITGREDSNSAMKIEDFKFSLPQSLYELLVSYNAEVYDFEYSEFILDQNLWDSTIVLAREKTDSGTDGKLVRFISENKFRVESFSHRETID